MMRLRMTQLKALASPLGEILQRCGPSATPTLKTCAALLAKLQAEAAAIADDAGDPLKNGSAVNRRITSSYAAMYQRRPDLHWVGSATFVSKQMGCNMRYTDQLRNASTVKQAAGRVAGHDMRKLATSTKTVLVRGNQAIFKDIYPQYRLYELSPRCATDQGDALHLNQRMVRGFKEYQKGNTYDGMMAHADYEQNVILQNRVMDNPALSGDVANFREAQQANREWLARWTKQSQPEQVSFSKECTAPGGDTSEYYYTPPPGDFTNRDERWDMAVPVLDKYDDLMQKHPDTMKEEIGAIGRAMDADAPPSYDSH